MSVFYRMDRVILIGTRMNTDNALVHKEIIYEAFITKKINSTASLPKTVLPRFRLKHAWRRRRPMLTK